MDFLFYRSTDLQCLHELYDFERHVHPDSPRRPFTKLDFYIDAEELLTYLLNMAELPTFIALENESCYYDAAELIWRETMAAQRVGDLLPLGY